LIEEYWDGDLSKFNEINDGSANAPTKISKLWELLFSGHQAMYDWESLDRILAEAGFDPILSDFRTSFSKQMLAETLDMMPCLSLYYEAKPKFN
jgi:hypothetical protein